MLMHAHYTVGTSRRIPGTDVAGRRPVLCTCHTHPSGSAEALAAGQRRRGHRPGGCCGVSRDRGEPEELACACARAADHHGWWAARRALRRAAPAQGAGQSPSLTPQHMSSVTNCFSCSKSRSVFQVHPRAGAMSAAASLFSALLHLLFTNPSVNPLQRSTAWTGQIWAETCCQLAC